MRSAAWLALVALGGCNVVFGLEEGSGIQSDDALNDAPDDGDGGVDGPDDGDVDVDGKPDPDGGDGGPVIEVVAGGNHTCARRVDGRLQCWGANVSGQLGLGNTNTIGDNEPASAGGSIPFSVPMVGVAAGGDHTCAVAEDADVYCWGAAFRGQLGHGNGNNIGDDEPAEAAGPVPVGAGAQRIATGAHHTCAVLLNSTLRCWGAGADGRLGYGNVVDVGDNESPAVAGNVAVPGSIVAVTAGTAHTCVLRNDGSVVCWGQGVGGRLGYGNSDSIGDNETPMQPVAIGEPVKQIVAGGDHTCVLTINGAVRCWGLNQFGQLGYGNTANIGDNEVPSAVGNVDVGGAVMHLAAGAQHTCALLNNGAVRCWGLNDRGQLGYGHANNIGDNESPSTGGDVTLGGVAIGIAAGAAHTCAVLEENRLICWGSAVNGQLGHGNLENIGDNETPASAGFVPLD